MKGVLPYPPAARYDGRYSLPRPYSWANNLLVICPVDEEESLFHSLVLLCQIQTTENSSPTNEVPTHPEPDTLPCLDCTPSTRYHALHALHNPPPDRSTNSSPYEEDTHQNQNIKK